MTARRHLAALAERFPVRGRFTIARGSRTHVEVVWVRIEEEGAIGQGEGVPYARYGETMAQTLAAIEGVRPSIEAGLDARSIGAAMPAGAARNAVDAALWDLAAKRAGCRAWDLLGLLPPAPVTTAYTLSLDSPEAMAEAASAVATRPLLKLKLDGRLDRERVAAVRAAAPRARLIVDANEAWTPDDVASGLEAMARLGVEMVEQPLPAGDDARLSTVPHAVPVGADESAHGADGLASLVGRYEVVNLKLDKTGGLGEALHFAAEAERLGLGLMVGCMLATSLAMAPAILPAQRARYVDLDGPLLLAADREPALRYEGSVLHPPEPALWG